MKTNLVVDEAEKKNNKQNNRQNPLPVEMRKKGRGEKGEEKKIFYLLTKDTERLVKAESSGKENNFVKV